jgi:CheY-like chemotaxis protein
MKIFILEDEIHQFPRKQILDILEGHEVTIATSCEDAKKKYVKGAYDLVLLDHDMRGFFDPSDYPNTGYQFASWLVGLGEVGKQRAPIMLHSQNPTGRRNMYIMLNQTGYVVAEMPFSNKYLEWLKDMVITRKSKK